MNRKQLGVSVNVFIFNFLLICLLYRLQYILKAGIQLTMIIYCVMHSMIIHCPCIESTFVWICNNQWNKIGVFICHEIY